MTTLLMARPPATRQLLALLLILFAGCGNMPELDVSQMSSTDLYRQAKEYENRGNLLRAAQNYQQLALRNDSPAREGHLLEAANLLSRADGNERARAVIASLDSKRLTTDQNLRLRLIQARIAMNDKQPRVALEQLQLPGNMALPADIMQEWYTLVGDANTLTGNPLEAARAWVTLNQFLRDEIAIHKNQQQIWAALNQYQESTLRNLRKLPPPDVFSGWVELTVLAKTAASQPSQLNQRLTQWRTRYPHHPASETLITGAKTVSQAAIDTGVKNVSQAAIDKLPDTVALLLPLTGSFSNQAAAVRDGFLAAYYARRNNDYNPAIRIYDTTDDVETGMASYRQALAEKADFIVGPLHKPLLERIISSGQPAVPTLALNYLGDEKVVVKNLYQFGLLPEDEASQVAERARRDGHVNALAMIPTGEWGDRISAIFSQRWWQLGGGELKIQRYDASQHDFAVPIKNMLNISNGRTDDSKKPDFIFVAAFPNQARQIRAQLKFYYAGKLPIYSTSHTFSGEVNATQDRDLNGILFCDMPWTLTDGSGRTPRWADFTNIWRASAIPFKRLYAMGIDAYSLMEQFNTLGATPQDGLNGESGTLYRDGANRIHRQLQWARFRNGKPEMLDAGAVTPEDDQ